MKHIVVKLLALIALACSLATTARAESFAKRVDIGGGRMMYIECHGSGSPTVLLISGTDTASDLWHAADQKGPTVYDDIQKTTRVCAYDRPGAPHLDQTFSRSDPVPQPTSPQNGVNDLVALALPAEIQTYRAYTQGIVTGSQQVDAAKALIAFLTSPAAKRALAAKGFEPQ